MAVVEGLSDGSLTAFVKDPVEAHPSLGGGPETELQELLDRRVDRKAGPERGGSDSAAPPHFAAMSCLGKLPSEDNRVSAS